MKPKRAESKFDERFVNHHRFRLFFNTTHIPKDEVLKAAELGLFRGATLNGTTQRYTIHVYDIVRPGIKGKSEAVLHLIDTKVVEIDSSATIRLNVMPAVARWLKSPRDNYGILVRVANDQSDELPSQQHIRLKRSENESIDEWAKQQPILMTYTDDERHKQREELADGRSRRRRDQSNMCQRKPFTINFEDIGWSDWIIAPATYESLYCEGECDLPFPDHLNSTNHAVVQTLVHTINPDMVPKACCVPTKLAPLTVLYLDADKNIVSKKFKDLIVKACGCR